MNTVQPGECREKLVRIRELLQSRGLDGLILGRRDNFAWLSGGGDNTVVRTSDVGFGVLVVTAKKVFLVAHVMDGQRILDDELGGMDVEPVFLRWFEEDRAEKALALAGSGKKGSDFPLDGAQLMQQQIALLHYPLFPREIERCRELGATTEEIIARVAAAIHPGMREREIEAMFLCEYAKEDISCEVLLVGSDERIAQYRHPVPSEKEVRKLVLLHPAAQKWGLHANVTRMVSFGAPSAEVEQKYEAANTVLAAAASRSIAGQSFAGILEAQKAAYAEAGFADEWRNHFQGGITGYILADATLCRDPRAVVSQGQTFDWFVTITGAKTEELVLSTEKGPQVLSAQGRWPVRSYDSFGSALELPVILVR